MPLVISRCFHKAVAIIYKPQVTSLRCTLQLMKTYFKDSEKQGRLGVVYQAAPEGWGGICKSFAAFLKAALTPSAGQEAAPLEMGDLVGMRRGEAATAPRWGPSPPLLPQPCQPRAPGSAPPAGATGAGKYLLPRPELPGHTHGLSTLGLGTCRVSILQGQLRSCGGQGTHTHVHAQPGLELPVPIPGSPAAEHQDGEKSGL